MATLHTVNKSPFEKNALYSCLRFAQTGSAILLIEDAVYAATCGTTCEKTVRGAIEKHNVYVLDPDLKARGIEPADIIDGIERVDYGKFVDLAVEHDTVQSWL